MHSINLLVDSIARREFKSLSYVWACKLLEELIADLVLSVVELERLQCSICNICMTHSFEGNL